MPEQPARLRNDERVAASLAVLFFLAYALSPPSLGHQDWDSLFYARATEVVPVTSMWGNHPLGHLLANLVFALARAAGYAGRALPLLQLWNASLGALTVGAFFSLGRRQLEMSRSGALGLAMLLGSSAAFWRYAGTANVYGVALAFSVLAWASLARLAREPTTRAAFVAGAFVAVAVLSHQFLVFLIPVAWSVLFVVRPRSNAAAVTVFTLVALSAIVLGYAVAGVVTMGSASPGLITAWLRGHVGDPTYGRYFGVAHLRPAAYVSLGALVHDAPGRAAWLFRFFVGGALVALVGAALFRFRSLPAVDRALLSGALFQCAVNGLLILWWEPHLAKFWLLTLVPLLIAVGIGARSRPFPWTAEALLPLGIALFVFDGLVGAVPESRPDPDFEARLAVWTSHSRAEDVLITAGDLVLVAPLSYWANRPKTVNLYRELLAGSREGDPIEAFLERIRKARCRGAAVLFAPAAARKISESDLALAGVPRERLVRFFESLGGEPAFTYRRSGDVVEVLRLEPLSGCGDP